MAVNQTKIGDCEVCINVNLKTTCTYGNIWMCDECIEKERKLTEENMKPENVQARVNATLHAAAKIDESVVVKTDLFNAATVASVELKAAIENDENIPADQKQYVYANACLERFQKFQKTVFDQRQELLENENKMRMWQTQVQQAASTLRGELREKFKQFDVNYQPAPPKTVKPASPRTSKKKFSREELNAAIKKYNLDGSHATAVQMLVTAKNWTVENAAKDLAVKLGKYTE